LSLSEFHRLTKGNHNIFEEEPTQEEKIAIADYEK